MRVSLGDNPHGSRDPGSGTSTELEAMRWRNVVRNRSWVAVCLLICSVLYVAAQQGASTGEESSSASGLAAGRDPGALVIPGDA